MGFKTIVKLVVFLGTLFIVLYISVNNQQSAALNFPLLQEKKVVTEAWEIYFGMFAIGVFAGAVLMAGGGKGRSKSPSKGDK
jgi:uncharacterized membrane protein YciS (DUF1049 family)